METTYKNLPLNDLGRPVLIERLYVAVTLLSANPQILVSSAFLFLLLLQPGGNASAQFQSGSVNRDRGIQMLQAMKQDLKDYYYDPNFRGIDLDQKFKTAEQAIKNSKSTAQIFGILGEVLIDLDDSHTFFLPPTLVTSVDYGWRMQTFGDKAYIIAVDKESDAAAKGLKVGDEVFSIDGFRPTRTNLWEIEYSYYLLMPATRMTLITQEANGTQNQIELTSKIEEHNVIRVRPATKAPAAAFFEASKDLLIAKLPEFDVSDKAIDELMSRSAKYQGLILDLRGNPGGALKTLQRMLGYFFEKDVKIGEAKGRKDNQILIAKSRAERAFKGKLIVLVDSESASASEIFAKVIQFEKRGLIVGDQTPGKVMAAITIGHPLGTQGQLWTGHLQGVFGVNVTIKDIIMSDGKSLERLGVTPDELIVPTGANLANREDPVLSQAAAHMGIVLDPTKAGTLFPSRSETEKEINRKTYDW